MVTTTNPNTIDTTIDMTFAERLTTIRHQQALTQQTLAERAGTHISNIRRYEAGTSTPTLDALRNLALALNTSADTLIFDPHDDLKHAFEAASTRLDPEGKEHLKATLEGLLLRTEARRWTA
jgi:transcriptional regulator with XRE-family HTH domain